jgi:hypothetical protein
MKQSLLATYLIGLEKRTAPRLSHRWQQLSMQTGMLWVKQ